MKRWIVAFLTLIVVGIAFAQGRSILSGPAVEIFPVRNALTQCSLGNTPGCFTRFISGTNNDIGLALETVWDASGPYTFYPTTAIEVGCESTDVNDTAVGTGSQTLTIEGNDINWDLLTQTIAMNGTTQVVLPIDMLRMTRIISFFSGTEGGSNVGTIFCEATVGGGGIAAGDGIPSVDDAQQMLPGNGNSRAPVFTVPNNTDAAISNGTFQVGKADEAEFAVLVRLNPEGAPPGAFFGPVTSLSYQNSFIFGAGTLGVLPPHTDIKAVASKGGGGGTVTAVAAFQLQLFTNEAQTWDLLALLQRF